MHAVADLVEEQPAVIDRFAGPTHWLNNRSWHRSGYDGRIYMSVEHAYAAAKSDRDFDRSEIGSIASPKEAYEYGRQVPLRADWDARIRYEAMYGALAASSATPNSPASLRPPATRYSSTASPTTTSTGRTAIARIIPSTRGPTTWAGR